MTLGVHPTGDDDPGSERSGREPDASAPADASIPAGAPSPDRPVAEPVGPDRHRQRRAGMVRLLERRGLDDHRVLRALAAVPRHRFVPDDLVEAAYDDRPLPIGSGQTISQPFMVAVMATAAAIGPDDRVAEIGTGSGYAAAVLSELAAEVVTVERFPELARLAAQRLDRLGCDNVRVLSGDGLEVLESLAPFDAVLVAAAAESVPSALVRLLGPGGRLVLPVGPTDDVQHLERVLLTDRGPVVDELGAVRFVPLVPGTPHPDR